MSRFICYLGIIKEIILYIEWTAKLFPIDFLWEQHSIYNIISLGIMVYICQYLFVIDLTFSMIILPCPRIWKDMSLDDSLTIYERSKLAVWDYPVSDTYTKMWQAMKEAGLPSSFEEGVERVRASPSSSEGYAFLGNFARMDS